MTTTKSIILNSATFIAVSMFLVSCQKNVTTVPSFMVSGVSVNNAVYAQTASITFTNFNASSNPGTATSLWLNIHTKINRPTDLANNGDYIMITSGTITLNSISSDPTVTNVSIPDGKIIADNTVSSPATSFDESANLWITKVPLGYTSSDIFICGAIINSSNGFTVSSGKSSTISAAWVTNKTSFTSSWFYGLSCYQPQFSYSDVSAEGMVTATGGGIKAGTPVPERENLVAGGSGGGGSNYTGSYSSTVNYAATTAIIDDGGEDLGK